MILPKSKLAALASQQARDAAHDLLGMIHAAEGGRVERALLSLAKGMVAVPVHEIRRWRFPCGEWWNSISLKMWMIW